NRDRLTQNERGGSSMRRRDFIAGLGGTAAAWPLATRAQAKLPTIGFLGANSPSVEGQWTRPFVLRLPELGWIGGRNAAIGCRWAEGRFERSPDIIAEFVRVKVDVIVTHATANVIAAKQVTSVIPIVFTAVAGDPLHNNLVASLARPSGNVTGLSNQAPHLAGKRLELLRDVIPRLRRLALLANVDNPTVVRERREAQAAAHMLGLEVATFEIRRAEDIAPAVEALKGGAEALYVIADPLMTTNRVHINTLALSARLPTVFSFREFVGAGGLMSYGPNLSDQFRRAGDFVDKILRGTKPADLPVEQPTRFYLVVNLTTAKALGLTILRTFLVRADEVIE